MFQVVSTLSTSGFALRASRPGAADSVFRVSLSQPLRVERGQALLAIPSGQTKAGEAVHNAVAAGLEPSGLQMDLAFDWERSLGSWAVRLGATMSREPGQRRDVNTSCVRVTFFKMSIYARSVRLDQPPRIC